MANDIRDPLCAECKRPSEFRWKDGQITILCRNPLCKNNGMLVLSLKYGTYRRIEIEQYKKRNKHGIKHKSQEVRN